jgi:DNA invertase Pin-like site-specific DNA recombinase
VLVGYARTSTDEQKAGLEAQLRDLKAAGVEKPFSEEASSVAERPQLAACLDFLREGDVLICTKPDRLARSTSHLLQIVERLEGKRVDLVILSMSGQRIDTRSPTGRLMLTMLGAIACFERDLMLERQREGIAKLRTPLILILHRTSQRRPVDLPAFRRTARRGGVGDALACSG